MAADATKGLNLHVARLGVCCHLSGRADMMITLTVARLENARVELEALGKTTDPGVNRLLRSLSLYGYRQPTSRESHLTMWRKIKALCLHRLTSTTKTIYRNRS
jgi:hypothetical protein